MRAGVDFREKFLAQLRRLAEKRVVGHNPESDRRPRHA
jgi:hypothetical protein